MQTRITKTTCSKAEGCSRSHLVESDKTQRNVGPKPTSVPFEMEAVLPEGWDSVRSVFAVCIGPCPCQMRWTLWNVPLGSGAVTNESGR